MVEIPFLFLEGVFTAIWLIIRIAVWMKQKKIDRKREIVLLLTYINLAVILRFTFFPMSKVDGHIQPLVLDTAAVFPFRVNLIPLPKEKENITHINYEPWHFRYVGKEVANYLYENGLVLEELEKDLKESYTIPVKN